jgi:hypothetical protein
MKNSLLPSECRNVYCASIGFWLLVQGALTVCCSCILLPVMVLYCAFCGLHCLNVILCCRFSWYNGGSYHGSAYSSINTREAGQECGKSCGVLLGCVAAVPVGAIAGAVLLPVVAGTLGCF